MNTGISFFNSVKSAVCRPLLDWQLLTPETTFGLLVDKVGGMTFWKQISQAFLTLSFSLFSLSDFFSLSSFAPHSTIRTPGTGYVSFPWTRHVSASDGERSRFRQISVITFPFFLVSVTFAVTFFCKIAWSMFQKFCLCDLSRWITVNFIYSWDRATL